MNCTYPVTLNVKGKGVTVRCGKCMECLIDNVTQWATRLKAELYNSDNAFFVTLTYNDKDPSFTGHVEKDHFRGFIKSLRNQVDYEYRKAEKVPEIAKKRENIRYFGCGEYGETERPHYHLLIFNLPLFRDKRAKFFNYQVEANKAIDSAWGKGFISIGSVTPASIHYVCKYIMKGRDYKGRKKDPFRLMSTNPAIGSNYVNLENQDYHRLTEHYQVRINGENNKMPKYYKSKLLDDDDKERLKEKAIAASKDDLDWYELSPEEKVHRIHTMIEFQREKEILFKLKNKQKL